MKRLDEKREETTIFIKKTVRYYAAKQFRL